MSSTEKSHIALDTLKRVESQHTNLWSVADDLRQTVTAGKHLEGGIFSLAEAMLLSRKLQRGEGPHYHSALLGALVAWRPTKGIYRFHPELYESLIETDLEGEIPSDVLLRMPSWAVFIETPASENMPFQVDGFWAYLSRLGNQNELVLVGLWRKEGEHLDIGIDPDWDILLFALPLGNHPVSDLTEKMYRQGAHDAGKAYEQRPDGVQALQDHVVSAMLSLLLYLCSEQPDILNWKPEQPQFKYLGKRRRWLASKNGREWDVGLRLGAALKNARERLDATGGATGNGTPARPHVRRAHWHSYWIGKRGEQSISLRWLPPIPVNVADAEKLPAVLHPVMGPDAP